jgi:DNA-binding MarR family transcriptional regulator
MGCDMESQKSFSMEMRSLHILLLRKTSELSGIAEHDPNVTLMQSRTMEFLIQNKGKEVFQRDIEKDCEIRRPTATKILQSMERCGLIERHGVDYDARLKQIFLTEKALNIRQSIFEVFDSFEAEMVKGLTEEELHAFFKIIDKVKRNLEEI